MDNQSDDLKAGFLKVLSRIRRKDRVHSMLWQRMLSRFYPNHRVMDGPEFFDVLVNAAAHRPPTRPLSVYFEELAGCLPLQRAYRKAFGDTPDSRMTNPALAAFYYAFIRETRPARVVETGTGTGFFTSLILAALCENDEGELISIDIPPQAGVLTMDLTLQADAVGFLIPEELRGRWQYLAGDAKLILPRVLASNDVDIFIHDSLHTRTHMSFEYAVARALLRPNAVIASDDSLWNGAWLDFVHTHRLTSLSCVRNPNLCVAINTFDDFEVAQGLGIQR